MKYCYVAEPIDRRPGGVGYPPAAAFPFPHYRPSKAWDIHNVDLGPEIQRVNALALEQAHVMLVVWSAQMASVGVPMEMQRARDLGIPVVVWSDIVRERSAVLVEFPCQWTNIDTTAQLMVLDQLARDRHPNEHTQVWPVEQLQVFDPDEPITGSWIGTGVAPRAGMQGDAGYDLTASESVVIEAGAVGAVPFGIGCELPAGWWGLIQGRSSSWKRGLSVKASVIDNGYRGMLWADVLNIGRKAQLVEAGERIAQLIPMRLAPPIVWTHVDSLSVSERGDRGYGSSGR